MNRLYHGRLKRFWLQHAVQCTMLESAVLTWPSACCASNCTLLAALTCFFHSRYVRAATLLSISQARKWFPSLWSLKSKSPVISTWLSKESALSRVLVDFSVARGQLRPPRYSLLDYLLIIEIISHFVIIISMKTFHFVPFSHQLRKPHLYKHPGFAFICHSLPEWSTNHR